jgi:SAM-dependent methyltransferase
MIPWYEDDDFWRAVEPALFSTERLALAKPDVDGIAELLSLQPGARILDLCSGPGRHAIELAKRGFKVTAVDRTHFYLERAKNSAKEHGVEVEFIEEDMRRFVRLDAFDVVINLSTSFGYFEEETENRQVLNNIYNSLRIGGAVLFEMNSKEILARDFHERTWVEIGDVLLLEQRSLDKDWHWLESRWILVRDGKKEEFRWKIRLYSGSEFEEILLRAGFKEVRLCGTLDGAPYNKNARRLVAVARKGL